MLNRATPEEMARQIPNQLSLPARSRVPVSLILVLHLLGPLLVVLKARHFRFRSRDLAPAERTWSVPYCHWGAFGLLHQIVTLGSPSCSFMRFSYYQGKARVRFAWK